MVLRSKWRLSINAKTRRYLPRGGKRHIYDRFFCHRDATLVANRRTSRKSLAVKSRRWNINCRFKAVLTYSSEHCYGCWAFPPASSSSPSSNCKTKTGRIECCFLADNRRCRFGCIRRRINRPRLRLVFLGVSRVNDAVRATLSLVSCRNAEFIALTSCEIQPRAVFVATRSIERTLGFARSLAACPLEIEAS